ncbi:MAG: radical SAM protein, partial [Thermodesulfobacteriota bacterium]|nr:radical SAM protein [Thermodesulfobacteriota bacterium]
MINLKTITTIELANICNLQCEYCVNRLLVKHPSREPGIMSDEVFERTLFWLDILCRRGTQKEVWLNGIGESCLDPKLIERTRVIKNVMGDKEVGLCTNGVNMTLEMAKALRGSGLDRLDLSPHSPFHVRRAASYMIKAGWVGRSVINLGIFNATHNWCGQLEPENQVETHLDALDLQCDPLIEGRGYVLK